MKKYSTVLFLFFLNSLFSQELYLPRNIERAYAGNTRDISGLPGVNYWQNGGTYNMKIQVVPEKRLVKGSGSILYENKSPDTLTELALRFVNNVHKAQSPKNNYVPEGYLSAGLKINSIRINNREYELSDNFGTVTKIKLQNPLPPGSDNMIEISWEYPLSEVGGRDGQIDKGTFFIAYSYPRISAYDDYNGWDMLPHLGRGEFYNDYNNYSFEISVPKNFIVWATGELENPQEILQKDFLKKYYEAIQGDRIIRVAAPGDLKGGRVTVQNDWNVWKFFANGVNDFAFAISNDYAWDMSSVQLKNKRVALHAAYKEHSEDFEQYISWMKTILTYYSSELPGIEYPYPTLSAVMGFGDMEYPMMVNDTSRPGDLSDAKRLLSHEIAHTYFPFYVGTNETRYAFMDEGFTVFFENLVGASIEGKEKQEKAFENFRVKRWITNGASENDQPIINLSSQTSGDGYTFNAYTKPALALFALKDLLGDELFKEALHFYMDAWKGKHPIPWDFFNSFNTASGRDLNWFWNNWYFTNSYIDLRVEQATQQAGKLNLTLVNEGGFAIPFDVVLHYEDGTTSSQHFTPEVWKSQEKKITLSVSADKKVKEVVADGGVFLDYTQADNRLKL